MSKKIEFTKSELKNPDVVLANLKQGFEWSASHSKAVITFLVIFAILGGGWSLYSVVRQQTEDKLQEKFYLADKKYNELRTKFEEAQKPKVDDKAKADPKDKNPKKKTPEVAVKPSQNPDADFAEPIKEMRVLIEASPASKAALMAALSLSEIYTTANKPEEALKVLDLVIQGKKVNGLLGAFATKAKGNIQADLGRCPEAIQTWQKLNSSDESLSFLNAEIKLKMGLCYEKSNQEAQAEMIYKELIDKVKNPGQQPGAKAISTADQMASKEAEKYLRLMKIKKENRGS